MRDHKKNTNTHAHTLTHACSQSDQHDQNTDAVIAYQSGFFLRQLFKQHSFLNQSSSKPYAQQVQSQYHQDRKENTIEKWLNDVNSDFKELVLDTKRMIDQKEVHANKLIYIHLTIFVKS